MKKHLLIIIASILIFGCNQSEIKKLNEENASLNKEREGLIEQANAKDSTLDSFIGTLNNIEDNLALIRQKQSTIALNTEGKHDLKINIKDEINEDIKAIHGLMDQNKKMIASLSTKLKKSKLNIHELEEKMFGLNSQLEAKNQELIALNNQLSNSDVKIKKLFTAIDTITAEGSRKSKTIQEQISKLNTAYYALGTNKELKDKNVINKGSKFLGLVSLPAEKKLKQDFNSDYFTTIDITQTNSISIGSKKAQIITTHPSNSYKLIRKGEIISDLIITNPDEFWKASKYLVIQLN